ncbi:MAG: hypothetical protein IJ365_01465, partial [Clostridia bacterium]|nr:hypothetical protein [Clostridia bacterium]
MKKVLALVLCIAMVLSTMSFTAFAETAIGVVILDSTTNELTLSEDITAENGQAAIAVISGNATITVASDVTVIGDTGAAGIYVAPGASLTIKGTGTLTAIGNAVKDDENGGAGIGGMASAGFDCGDITIDGATVIAYGYGKHASGIGAGISTGTTANGEGINIINGANVTAYGGYYADGVGTKLQSSYGKSDPEGGAAIGGGYKTGATIKPITITNSTVTAYGGSKSAAIGASFWSSAEKITITDSTVIAQGGSSSAGIGTSRAGDNGVTADIEITGSTVNATGGDYGAGIGGGYNADSVKSLPEISIEISGGKINATGVNGGAAIGGGYKTNNLDISITDRAVVTAVAGVLDDGSNKTAYQTGACAIGSGANGSGTFVGSTVVIEEGVTVDAKTNAGKEAIERVSFGGTTNDNDSSINGTVNLSYYNIDDMAAAIGQKHYLSLEDAMGDATDGATIDVLKDVDVFPRPTKSATFRAEDGVKVTGKLQLPETEISSLTFENFDFTQTKDYAIYQWDNGQEKLNNLELTFKDCVFGAKGICIGWNASHPNWSLKKLVINNCKIPDAQEVFSLQDVQNVEIKNCDFSNVITERQRIINVSANSKNVVVDDCKFNEGAIQVSQNIDTEAQRSLTVNNCEMLGDWAVVLHNNFLNAGTNLNNVTITNNTFYNDTEILYFKDMDTDFDSKQYVADNFSNILFANNIRIPGEETEKELIPGYTPDAPDARIGDVFYLTISDAVTAAEAGDTITVIDNVSDEEVTVDKNVIITSDADNKKTLNNVTITINGATVELTVSDLKFTGNSYINANNGAALTVTGCVANVEPEKVGDNSRAAFIVAGTGEPTHGLKLVVTDNTILSAQSNTDFYSAAIFGWRYLADGTTIARNTFGSADKPYTFIAVKTLNAMDGATFTIENNTIYGTDEDYYFAAIDLYQNCSRDNTYTVMSKNNNIIVEIDGTSDYTPYPFYLEGNGGTNVILLDNGTKFNGRALALNDIDASGLPEGYDKFYSVDVTLDEEGKLIGGKVSSDVNAASYIAAGYQASRAAFGYDVVPATEIAETISVKFVEDVAKRTEESKVYNIVLKANDADQINELASAELTFALTADSENDGAINFTVLPEADFTLTRYDDLDINRYMFNYNGKTAYEGIGNEIVVGTITVDGYGTFTIGTDNDSENAKNVVHATTVSDNLVDTYTVEGLNGTDETTGGLVITDKAEDKIEVPTRTLNINITFPNAVEYKEAAYQDMTVTIVGGNVNDEIELGDNAKDYAIEKELPYNTAYTVSVSGAGYRTARYSVTLTEDKTLNFWNNVMDNALEVEVGKATSAANSNFLAGDIVKDNNI